MRLDCFLACPLDFFAVVVVSMLSVLSTLFVVIAVVLRLVGASGCSSVLSICESIAASIAFAVGLLVTRGRGICSSIDVWDGCFRLPSDRSSVVEVSLLRWSSPLLSWVELERVAAEVACCRSVSRPRHRLVLQQHLWSRRAAWASACRRMRCRMASRRRRHRLSRRRRPSPLRKGILSARAAPAAVCCRSEHRVVRRLVLLSSARCTEAEAWARFGCRLVVVGPFPSRVRRRVFIFVVVVFCLDYSCRHGRHRGHVRSCHGRRVDVERFFDLLLVIVFVVCDVRRCLMVVCEACANRRSGRCDRLRQQLDERDVPDVLTSSSRMTTWLPLSRTTLNGRLSNIGADLCVGGFLSSTVSPVRIGDGRVHWSTSA